METVIIVYDYELNSFRRKEHEKKGAVCGKKQYALYSTYQSA